MTVLGARKKHCKKQTQTKQKHPELLETTSLRAVVESINTFLKHMTMISEVYPLHFKCLVAICQCSQSESKCMFKKKKWFPV